MRRLAEAWMAIAVLTAVTIASDREFTHVCTIGSKQGIHPPRVLNRRATRAALGNGENPYGLLAPVAVTTDLRGRVWITDSGTASIHVFDRSNGGYREIKRVDENALRQPSGIASDPQGRVFAADLALGGLLAFDEAGEYGRWMVRPGSDLLKGPTAIALSEDGKTIYVADPPRDRIVALNREGEVNGSIDLPPQFGEPSTVSVIDNQVYVLCRRQHKVGVFSPAGRLRGEIHWDGVLFPTAFAYDPVHRWFLVADPQWMIVRGFDPDGRNLFAFGQMGEGIDQMQRVDSLYVDPQGLVYLVDSRSRKVLVFGDSRRNSASVR